jgi:hypothetical protein
MHNSFVMGGRKSLGDAERIFDRAPYRKRTGFDLFAQSLPVKKFADQKGRAFVRPNVVDAENVRMTQRGDGSRFLFKAPALFASVAGSTLIATSLPRRVSRARQTSPMPPVPSRD